VRRQQVFRLSWQNRVLALIEVGAAVVFVGGPVLSICQANGQSWLSLPFVVTALFALAIVGMILWQAFGTHLIVSPGGLEYHELGITIVATWRDVHAVKTRRHVGGGRGGSWSDEGLVLAQSQMRASPIWAFLFHLRSGNDFIPLTPLAFRWRSTELGTLIRRYATHLDKQLDIGN